MAQRARSVRLAHMRSGAEARSRRNRGAVVAGPGFTGPGWNARLLAETRFVLSKEGKWRSQRSFCSAGLSPPRRRLSPRRHCCLGPPGRSGCESAGSQRQVMMSRAPRASVRAVTAGASAGPCGGALVAAGGPVPARRGAGSRLPRCPRLSS